MANFTSTSGSYTTTLTVTQTSQSTQNNQSTLTYSLTLTKNAGSGLWNNNSCPWSITIDGSQVASGTFTYDFRNYSSLTLKSSTTTTVNHNSDGTKTVSVSASVNMNNSDYVSVMQPSGSLTLTTIPRASEVSVSSYSITNTTGSLSATITSKANFYHKWRWKIGSGSWSAWTNKGQINNTSSTVTVANTSLLAGMPISTSASFNIEVQTYSDSGYANLVGTKSATCTVSVNTSNIKPSVSLGNIAINSSPISGYAVAGYSSVKSTATTTNSSGASSFTNYFTVSSGSLTSSTSTSASTTVKTNTVPSSSSNYTLTIYAYAKDSRGAVSSTVSKSITVYGYQQPTATLNAYRVASSSATTEDGAGTYAYVTFSGAVSSSVNSQNTIQSTTCTYGGSISGTATSGGHYALSDTQTVTFTLTVTDKVTSSTAVKTINTASYPLDLYDDGRGTVGVGFGAVAEAGKATINLNTYIPKNNLYVGTIDDTSRQTELRVRGGAGQMFFFSQSSATGTRGMYASAHGNGAGKNVFTIDTDNDITFNGKANSADNATSATNATNTDYVRKVNTNPTSATTYEIPFIATGTTGYGYTIRDNDGIAYRTLQGTDSAQGYSILYLGTGTATGTAGNKTGAIRVYSNGAGYTEIRSQSGSKGYIAYLPNLSSAHAYLQSATSLWTGTLKGGNTLSLDMSAYSRIKVYTKLYGVNAIYEIDLSATNAYEQISGYRYSNGCNVAEYTSGGNLEYLVSQSMVSTDKKKFRHYHCGYSSLSGSYTSKDNDANYYVYKIEGMY